MVLNRVALWEVSLSASAPYLPWHVKLRHQELCDVLMQHCMLPLCMCPFCSQCPGGCLQLPPVPSPQDPIPLALFLNFCLAPMAEIGIRSDCFQYSVHPLSHCSPIFCCICGAPLDCTLFKRRHMPFHFVSLLSGGTVQALSKCLHERIN